MNEKKNQRKIQNTSHEKKKKKNSCYYSSNACVFCILVVDYYLFVLNTSELHKSLLYFTPTARDSVQCYTIILHRLYDFCYYYCSFCCCGCCCCFFISFLCVCMYFYISIVAHYIHSTHKFYI